MDLREPHPEETGQAFLAQIGTLEYNKATHYVHIP